MSPSVIASVFVGAGLSLALAGPPAKKVDRAAIEAERARCKKDCAASESGTDRGTCELVCDNRADGKLEGPEYETWHTEKNMGGPAPEVPTGSEAARATRPTTGTMSSAFAARLGLAKCQARCDEVDKAVNRWMCKAQCLDKHPTPRSVLGSIPTGAPVQPSLGTKNNRATAPPAAAKPTPQPAPKAEKSDRACKLACEAKASSCRSGCSGTGSDKTTCRLQCDQAESSCKGRC